MSMIKKDSKGLCPFNSFKKCNTKCSLFRCGFRYYANGNEPTPFESCAINIIADNAELTHQRIYTLQKEFGEMKNMSAFATLVSLGLESEDNLARIVKSCMNLPDNNNTILIEENKKQDVIEDKPKKPRGRPRKSN